MAVERPEARQRLGSQRFAHQRLASTRVQAEKPASRRAPSHQDSCWDEDEVTSQRTGAPTVVLVVNGKIRGSRARRLGDKLEEVARGRRVRRAVLDLRKVDSIDSVGVLAFEEAIALGLKLDLVVRRGFELDDGRQATELARKGLKVHATLEAALEPRRSMRLAAAAS